jgi:hypothetical protein
MKKFPNLNIDTTIEIGCKDNKELKAIYVSLAPDNINFPKNLELEMKTTNSSFLLKLKSYSNIEKEDNTGSLINTVDEILEHIGIIKNVIKND